MPEHKQTHREVKEPKMSARLLADYMAATETGGRSIVRKCKYQKLAQVFQHDEAKIAVSKFIRSGSSDTASLTAEAQKIRDRMADSDFDRDLFDHNADYIDRFAKVFPELDLPSVEILAPGKTPSINLSGVRVTADIAFRLRRITKTNEVRVGAAILRYAKSKALPIDVADWQSAIIMGYLTRSGVEEGAEPEHKLCITVDAHVGKCHLAPTDSVRRFKQTEDACATIAEWWPGIGPPPGAVL